MSTRGTQSSNSGPGKSSFFQQRDALVNDIALSLETVLQNINKVNRSLEGVIAVGNEFGAVEALWSQFEGVMAQEPEGGEEKGEKEGDDGAEEEVGDEEKVEEGEEEIRGSDGNEKEEKSRGNARGRDKIS